MSNKNGSKKPAEKVGVLNPDRAKNLGRVEQAIHDLHGAFITLDAALDAAELRGLVHYEGVVRIDESLETALGWSGQGWSADGGKPVQIGDDALHAYVENDKLPGAHV